MEWIIENINILATFASALTLYTMLRRNAHKDIESLKNEILLIKREMDSVNVKLDSINMRLTRLEGRFEERGYWESRRTGTEELKS